MRRPRDETRARKRDPPTSRCGRRPSPASRPGTRHGARAPGLAHRVLGDGDEVPRARRSTSTAAGSTWSSRTTRTSSPSPTAPTATAFARYWLHNGLLNTGGIKMCKSLGNVVFDRRTCSPGSRRPQSVTPSSHRTTGRTAIWGEQVLAEPTRRTPGSRVSVQRATERPCEAPGRRPIEAGFEAAPRRRPRGACRPRRGARRGPPGKQCAGRRRRGGSPELSDVAAMTRVLGICGRAISQ